MLSGMSRTTAAAVGSLVLLGLLAAALGWRGRDAGGARPLVVYAAAAVRVPLEVAARDYEAAHGRHVALRFGASEDILTRAGLVNPSDPADVFLPADDSYVRTARDRGLVADGFPLATMRAVVLLAPGNPKGLAGWADLQRDGARVAVPNRAAAVGKLTRDHLTAAGRWETLKPRVADTGTVTEAANAAKVGAADAAVVWDAVAVNYPGQAVLTPPELAGVVGRVEVAVLTQSADRDAALGFARYLADPERGLKTFRTAGFTP
ncbi:molybdate ABC transporter substrate-binding protein [Urbifossiella limnaea]|uniref:Binding protein n=1 Tax=Urbifossiella limnaea TaxID=2528023 RepID=A0A517XPN4_9BACT|nr:molybdate ABC transporter substrate-binding protein [Urbifossiella limnaea]QDU19467.1 Putative binding protein precursor [Urbifossiella limnaea]